MDNVESVEKDTEAIIEQKSALPIVEETELQERLLSLEERVTSLELGSVQGLSREASTDDIQNGAGKKEPVQHLQGQIDNIVKRNHLLTEDR